ncbi:alpha/beta hydrolase [Pseudonocardia hydrocarbonoxydans]|uniref:Esterase n=1 Tax=Pseudonocardia hydrocarbonoxydans TaxID=76726 RepID=A0A4Y3WXE6_9PSEU|nr:alpha/beta hydrolase fold domain-containing protein [Pseudonocardia hydrocarbonoxydans]GEC22419.1 esterase [Pseudonocardia hydrocarbonoxydans]
MTSVARPDFDPELKAGLAVVGGVFPPTITPDLIAFMRRSYASPPIEDTLRGRAIERSEHTIAGHRGDPVGVSVLRPAGASGPRPGVLFVHSGGLMFGDRFSGADLVLDWVDQLGAVLVAVEYRLAPEFGDPFPREDCYAALEWTAAQAGRLGIRRDRLMVAGASSGGGLAAGMALAARDRGGPALCGQVLDYPMLDDRGVTPSTAQFDGVGVWDRISNETGWTALLGAARGGPDVSPYAAPARATDLSRLPPAFIDVGAAEIFRDESIAYADRIWACGGDAELHVWAGGFHAFDIFAPHTVLARGMIRTRDAWVEKILAD